MSTFPPTPLHLEILLCAYTGGNKTYVNTCTSQAYTLDLKKEGLIWESPEGELRVTEYGEAKLEKLLLHLYCKRKALNQNGKANRKETLQDS